MKNISVLQSIHQVVINRKKMLLSIILLFFLKSFLFSQSLEKIKESDTVFIYFKNNSIHEIKDMYKNTKTGFDSNRIDYILKVNNYDKLFFLCNDYLNYDDYEKGIKTDIKMLKKSFLRKNKHRVIDIDFFLNNGFKETYMNALYGKIVYLIDSSEIKGRKIKAKQVKVRSNYHEL